MAYPIFSVHLLLLLLLVVTSIGSQQQQHQPQQQQQDLSHSRFVCTALPADANAACPLPGFDDDVRASVLQLRDTVLRHKETILEQRESIRDLTAKLQQCEGTVVVVGAGGATGTDAVSTSPSSKHPHGRKQQTPGKWRDTMGDPPRDPGEVIEQLGRTVQSLKDRLESLEGSTGGTGGSAHSLREFLHERTGEAGRHGPSDGGDGEGGEGGGHNNETDSHVHRHQRPQQRTRLDSTLASGHRLPNLDKIGPPPGHHAPDDFKVMFPARTNYMFVRVKHSLPTLHAFTICLWLRSGGPSSGTPFSYAVDDQPNELALMEWGSNPMELIINDKIARLPVSVSNGHWHHLCVTWSTRDGVWKAFQNGVCRGNGENLAPWRPIKAGGVLILGQEQDVVGGNFDATQAFLGEMAQFNVWDRELAPEEVMDLATCSRAFSGNVVAWSKDNIDVHGGLAHHPIGHCTAMLSNF